VITYSIKIILNEDGLPHEVAYQMEANSESGKLPETTERLLRLLHEVIPLLTSQFMEQMGGIEILTLEGDTALKEIAKRFKDN
jgi:hypothetical protein